MTTHPSQQPNPPGSISALVPFAHVADVELSLSFYALLGFARRVSHAGPTGRTVWAETTSAGARLMLAQASGPIDAGQQAVLFYMYSSDVASLRARLIAGGLHDAGRYTGQPGPGDGRNAVFDVASPFYMPAGELRVHDPDGYVLLIGQLS